jgi:hypothetical protein
VKDMGVVMQELLVKGYERRGLSSYLIAVHPDPLSEATLKWSYVHPENFLFQERLCQLTE